MALTHCPIFHLRPSANSILGEFEQIGGDDRRRRQSRHKHAGDHVGRAKGTGSKGRGCQEQRGATAETSCTGADEGKTAGEAATVDQEREQRDRRNHRPGRELLFNISLSANHVRQTATAPWSRELATPLGQLPKCVLAITLLQLYQTLRKCHYSLGDTIERLFVVVVVALTL